MRRAYSVIFGISFLCLSVLIWTRWTTTANNMQQKGRPLTLQNVSSVTIETGNEVIGTNQGFLQCAADTLIPNLRHDTTAKAFQDNLPSKPNVQGVGVVVGHGFSGFQCSGKGDDCNTSDDPIVLGNFNPEFWRQFVEKNQGKFESLTLLGCDIGQGNRGADLLFEVAKTVHMEVRAPDSHIFCYKGTGFTFADGGDWVIATPTSRPTPHLRRNYDFETKLNATFRVNSRVLTVPTTAIKILEFKHRTIEQSEPQDVRLETAALVQIVDFGSYFETSGRPGAVATGTFRIEIETSAGKIEKSFVLYNDDLVEDLKEQDAFYRANTQRLLDYVGPTRNR